MRIASVSDLHLDHPPNREVVVQMAATLEQARPDVVIIAGDVSHVDDHIARAVRSFRLVAEHVAYLPGNHDLWTVADGGLPPELDTWQRHDRDLKDLVEGEGGIYLPAGGLLLRRVAIVGSCGWYDHSFLLPEVRAQIGQEQLDAQMWAPFRWSDGRFVRFLDDDGRPMRDVDVADRMLQRFERQLQSGQDDPDVDHIVAATHHLAFEESVTRRPDTPVWEFFNAFMGSRRFGEALRRRSKVRAAIYGHTHVPGDRDLGGLRVVGTPLGYPRERDEPPQTAAQTRIAWIELPEP